jgi:hypothetical protein
VAARASDIDEGCEERVDAMAGGIWNTRGNKDKSSSRWSDMRGFRPDGYTSFSVHAH